MKDRGFSWRQTTVAKTEAGDRPVLLGEAVGLSEILGKGIEYFLEPQEPLNVVVDEAAESLSNQRRRVAQLQEMLAAAQATFRHEEATHAVAVAIRNYRESYDSGPLGHALEAVFEKSGRYAIESNPAYEVIGIKPEELQAFDKEALRAAAEDIDVAAKHVDRKRLDEESYAIFDAAAKFLRSGREDFRLFEVLRSSEKWIDISSRRVLDLIVEHVNAMPS